MTISSLQSRVHECENDQLAKVQNGLDFMLSHFSEPPFPRNVSTAATHGKQYTVDGIDRAMTFYQASLWEDCRIAGFGANQTNPDLIFIDIDRQDFATVGAFKMALTKTLKNIKDKLGGYPTVYWSGRGYHIIQPIHCLVNLDEMKELTALTNDPNNKFLQFTERYLTGNKNDSGHHPALRSCMLRVPGSLNSRCKAAGIDAEVKILQRWDGFRPDYRLLIGRFCIDLVGRNQLYREQKCDQKSPLNGANNQDYGPIDWIEKLLHTPIDDFRKRSRGLILVPYLVVRRGMTDVDQIHDIVMQWADKCAQLYRLEPSRHEYSNRVRSRIHEVMQSNPRIPPMRLETLKEKNPWLYEKLRFGV